MTSTTLHLYERREGSMFDYVRARWACGELDRRIAHGDDVDGDRLLSLRAAQLVKPAARATAATGLEGVVATIQKPRTPFSAAVPVRRAAVGGARHELMALAGDLRHMERVQPRGVAMAGRLITDPCSPLYTAASSDELVRAVFAASYWLTADPARL